VFLAPQFADASLQASVDLGKGVELQVGVANLFDRNYFRIEGYPEPGRAGYANLRYRSISEAELGAELHDAWRRRRSKHARICG